MFTVGVKSSSWAQHSSVRLPVDCHILLTGDQACGNPLVTFERSSFSVFGSLPRYAGALMEFHLRGNDEGQDRARTAARLACSAAHLQRSVREDDLESAAMLHSIGRSPDLVRTGFAPLDAALYLVSLGWPEALIRLVAHQSFMQVYAASYGVSHQMAIIEPVGGMPAEILAWAILSSEAGEKSSAQQLIASLRAREALSTTIPDTVRERRYRRLLKAVERVEQRLHGLSS